MSTLPKILKNFWKWNKFSSNGSFATRAWKKVVTDPKCDELKFTNNMGPKKQVLIIKKNLENQGLDNQGFIVILTLSRTPMGCLPHIVFLEFFKYSAKQAGSSFSMASIP